jgi:uncharacterized protein involved in exopolysaccharide biosynthesis
MTSPSVDPAGPTTRAAAPAARPVSPSLQQVAASLVARLPWLVVVPLVVGILVAGLVLLERNYYTSSTALVVQGRAAAAASQLAGLAALAGVEVGSASATESPQFYAAVLQGQGIRYALLRRRFATAGVDADWLAGRDSASLLDILVRPDDASARRLWAGANALAEMTDVGTDTKTGIVQVSVTFTSRTLAADVARAYVDQLTRFNLEIRQSQARARRRFVERRVQEVSAVLLATENAVRDFLSRNRRYQESPSLTFEYGRLQRAVTVQQELYLDLQRQLDAARISEVDDTPSLTIVEEAIPALMKAGPARKNTVLLWMVLSLAATAAWVFVRDHGARVFPEWVAAYGAIAPGLASWRTRLRDALRRRRG